MRKGYVVLAVLAATVGFGSAFAVDAASYKDIGTVAEGVYVVHGEAGTFKVQALDAVTAIVYDESGELMLARNLAPDEARTFVVGDAAVVAIAGGEAKVSAKGDGALDRIGKQQRTVELDEANGPVDEAFTVRMPPFLVGVQGRVVGEAEGLVVEITSGKGLVYRYDDGAVEADLSKLTREPMDARITAERLVGRIVLDVYVASLGDYASGEGHAMAAPTPPPSEHAEEREKHQREAMAHAQEHRREAGVPQDQPFEQWEQQPVRLVLDQAGSVTFDVLGGWGLDASLYDAAGAQAHYVQRGMTVAESRSFCDGPAECFFGGAMGGGRNADLAPEEVTLELQPGEYTMFVRLARADGVVHFEGVREARFLEVSVLEGQAEDGLSWQLEQPVLDILLYDWNPSVQSTFSAALDGATVYESRADLVAWPAAGMHRETMYEPGLLGAGTLELAYDGLDAPLFGGGPHYQVLVAGDSVKAKDEA